MPRLEDTGHPADDVASLGRTLLTTLAPAAAPLVRAGLVAEAIALAVPSPELSGRVLRNVMSRACHPVRWERWSDGVVLAQELESWRTTFSRGQWAGPPR